MNDVIAVDKNERSLNFTMKNNALGVNEYLHLKDNLDFSRVEELIVKIGEKIGRFDCWGYFEATIKFF